MNMIMAEFIDDESGRQILDQYPIYVGADAWPAYTHVLASDRSLPVGEYSGGGKICRVIRSDGVEGRCVFASSRSGQFILIEIQEESVG
jgi:hypothetical protein